MPIVLWLLVGPAIVLAFLSLRGERKRARYVDQRLAEAEKPRDWPRATVIVPVKGMDEGLRENLQSLASLDYPDYELVVSARTAADIPPGVLPHNVKVVLGSDEETGASEKIKNLIAGIKLVGKTSAVLAFADSDGRVPRGWLRALVAPLDREGVGASTGYRWYVPQPPDFWSLVRSVWNGAIVSGLGPGDCPFAWGGATAIRADLFTELKIQQKYWTTWVSDDYALAEAVHAAGLRIAFAPGAMVAATDHVTCRQFFRWAQRQMTITRVFKPALWRTGLIAHFVYCIGMAAVIGASVAGNRLAEWALLAQLSPGMLKGTNRAVLAKAELPEFKAWFDRHGWVHAIWVPFVTWIWLVTLLSAAFNHAIEWRGKLYYLSRKPGPAPDSGIQ
jgi:cellulose synthase/poly-beta-1,6-N-acetylglucosamine synthase-like glycosyltransferase